MYSTTLSGALNVLELVEIIFTFSSRSDRPRMERVSLLFHMACCRVEKREFLLRLQLEKRILLDSRFEREEEQQQELKESIKIMDGNEGEKWPFGDCLKIPFHMKIFVNYFRQYDRKKNHFNFHVPFNFNHSASNYIGILHPLMICAPISEWRLDVSDNQQCKVWIGSFKNNSSSSTTVLDLFLINRKESGSVDLVLEKVTSRTYGEFAFLDNSEKIPLVRLEKIKIGTMRDWIENFGLIRMIHPIVFPLKHLELLGIVDELYQFDLPELLLERELKNLRWQRLHSQYKCLGFVDSDLLQYDELEANFKILLRLKIINYCQLPSYLKDYFTSSGKERILNLIELDGLNLKHVGKYWHRDKSLVLKAVQDNGLAIQYASKGLQQDEQVLQLALQNPLCRILLKQFENVQDQYSSSTILDHLSYNLQNCLYYFGLERLTLIQEGMLRAFLQTTDHLLVRSPSSHGKSTGSLLCAVHCVESVRRKPETQNLGGYKIRDQVKCLILTPTRLQARALKSSAMALFSREECFLGDLSIGECTGGSHTYYYSVYLNSYEIILGTPGRISAKLRASLLEFSHVECIVFEDVEYLLSGSFDIDLSVIMSFVTNTQCRLIFNTSCPSFSSKFSLKLDKLFASCSRTNRVSLITLPLFTTSSNITHHSFKIIDETEKYSKLKEILDNNIRNENYSSCLIFCNSRQRADSLHEKLCGDDDQYRALCSTIHGECEDISYERILQEFINGTRRIVITTNILAFGIAVPHLGKVICFDFCENLSIFSNRLGRLVVMDGREKKFITFIENRQQENKLKSYLTEFPQLNTIAEDSAVVLSERSM